ncbi:MAG: hypothetical protein AB1647_08650 [Pseudomonadota bacterium]
MSEEKANSPGKKKERSPSFPFISLREAIKRLQAFEQTFGRHPAPASKSGLAWGMKDGSSQAFQTLAALKAFGLIEYEGSGKTLTAHLTEDARTYLRAQQEHIKEDVLRRIAVKPKQIQKFWQIWGERRPPDPVCLDALILNHAFTDSAASNFLKVYDDTIAYAGLSDSDTVTDEDDEEREDGPALEFDVGDLVNWESAGQVQWKNPRKIVSVDEQNGKHFYKVEGLGELAGQIGWIPVEQAIKHQGTPDDGAGFTPPPSDPAHNNEDATPKAGMRKAVFPVSDGDVTIIFPEGITPNGLDELGQYLDIFLKKEKKASVPN